MARRKREREIQVDAAALTKLGRVESRGAGTIQPKAISDRPGLHHVAKVFVKKGYTLQDVDGGYHAVLKQPIMNRDMIGYTSERLGDPDKKFMGKIVMLSAPAKMACPGFNAPAGPPSLGGTCVASVPGFPLLTPRQRAKVELSDAAKEGGGVRLDQWVCSGCYAIKNNYIYSNLQLGLEIRRLVVEDLMRRGTFVDMFERIIERQQVKLVRSRRWLLKHGLSEFVWTIGDPAFVRVHDSGDFWSPAYLRGWGEIARRFQKPRELGKRVKIQLPAVSFWAPTRIWAIKGTFTREDIMSMPSNFVLRPSALHFREPPPDLRADGYGSGSGIAAFGEDYRREADWDCPATYDPVAASSGVIAPKPKGLAEYEKGACNTSRGVGYAGPSSEEDAEPFGRGCRTCWLYRDLSVAYHEH